MSDYFIKALACDGSLRVITSVTTETVNEAQKRHHTWPTATAALGRTITATMMMAVQEKGDEKVTVTIQGGGPIGAIVADADTNGRVRGYVTNPQVHFELNAHGKLDVARAVGNNGFLSVVKDLGLRENFTGRVPIVSGELGDDFTYYYARSEQIPSAVGVGVLVNPDQSVKASGGFIIQVLPGADDAAIDRLEERLKAIPPISKLIDAGHSPEQLLDDLFPDGDYKVLEKHGAAFHCGCSKEKFGQSLQGLDVKEIQAMIDEDHGAEVVCHFCGTHYQFSADELHALIAEKN
ncbi:Hsp33 family molecular chaperone HslO [Sporolactobacillus terrae]|uniref:33 kDa chaperonin n=1 Tax=Sporolactobacillus terrae TaxID=269673 RepID=A0A410D554_9BACL|nr:Hsp33 family molecular chaperone HslO [Sporolactobacillus terrae]QAA21237.1 Hsp33 family molecular chaperone HslO [Sporolactobacillus terrae]QAA24209.1 Hsp33 family molecular chaperone HslO [Sporolactobacillus terrae]UAK16018.1 Hsp33 family molecular chaperone HslO [Sporolactobacillus terrae]BBN97376.1 33 kDa chaperonin [Sporolactobacillus terrae]